VGNETDGHNEQGCDNPCNRAAYNVNHSDLQPLLRSYLGDFGINHECLIWSQGLTTVNGLTDGLSH